MLALRLMLFLIFQSTVLSSLQYKAEDIQAVSKVVFDIVKYRTDKILEAAGVKNQCAKDLKKLLKDAIFLKRWALEMLDASSKIPSGLLAGNIYMTGNYDQCLNINHYLNETNIYGQYCTVFVTPDSDKNDLDFFSVGNLKGYLGLNTSKHTTELLKLMKVNYGLCIPHTCSIENLQNIWDYIENTFRLPVHMHFTDMMCRSRLKSDSSFEIDKYIKAFFFFYIILLLISTLYDVVIHQHMKTNKNNLWISFSLYSNFKRLISVQDASVEVKYLECISGIKVLSMVWIICGHKIMFSVFSGVTNLLDIYMMWRSSISPSFVASGVYAVDTFLFLSGLLLSYGILNYYSSPYGKKRAVPYLVIYAYRFLRLCPALLAIILFHITIFKNLAEGPMWPLMATRLAYTCYKTWFVTLSFASNFLQFNQQCMQHSWYLAVDTQLFLMSPILLNILIKKPIKTCLLCIVICIVTAIYTFLITIYNQYGATMFESDLSYQYNIYQATSVRLPAWLIGFIFGYLIYKYNDVNISPIATFFAWLVIFTTMIGLILVHLVFIRANEYIGLNAALYNSLAKQLWALAMGSTIFLCTINRNGLMNRFLSWSIFRILVKITYSAYLTHVSIIIYFIGSKQHSTYFSIINNIHGFIGDIVLTIVVSTIWCLAFESPFVAIARYLYKKEMVKETFYNGVIEKKKKNKNKNITCVNTCKNIQGNYKKIE
ncbi:nose resistant to fluoxetine protein 6-like [Diorhabda carinulata]|uniref:nose resistant to fluoxetine protein 6-like n=1 Tax=Diorhabda carinulata TaxID=1163345 RepID=UPI00259FE7EA|nr:nose resistant to fluoxetine protein 6-like [Diorhabda carinulata]